LTVDKLREFGIKTEFLGRVGLIFNLEKLSIESMYAALQNSVILDNYLVLFPSIKRDDVEEAIMYVVAKEHSKNTLGIRLLNTLINQYFINDGKLLEPQIDQTTFQTKLSFKVEQ
jgi:ATP-dependent protease Clp ATPase subunit